MLRNVVAENVRVKTINAKKEKEREKREQKENVHAGKKEGEKEFFHC